MGGKGVGGMVGTPVVFCQHPSTHTYDCMSKQGGFHSSEALEGSGQGGGKVLGCCLDIGGAAVA